MNKCRFVLEAGMVIFELELKGESDFTDIEAKEHCLAWLAQKVELWLYPETGKKIPVTISEVKYRDV